MHYFIARTVLMIACGAFGALTVGNVKWVWWFFGMLWFFHIIFALGKSWAEAAKAKGGESGSVYSKIAGITVITWFCYPIVWVFAEGFGNFSVTFEVSLARALFLCDVFLGCISTEPDARGSITHREISSVVKSLVRVDIWQAWAILW